MTWESARIWQEPLDILHRECRVDIAATHIVDPGEAGQVELVLPHAVPLVRAASSVPPAGTAAPVSVAAMKLHGRGTCVELPAAAPHATAAGFHQELEVTLQGDVRAVAGCTAEAHMVVTPAMFVDLDEIKVRTPRRPPHCALLH